MEPSIYILAFFMIATFLALVAGLVVMAGGGRVNEKYSSKIMMARVGLQASALVLLVVFFLAS